MALSLLGNITSLQFTLLPQDPAISLFLFNFSLIVLREYKQLTSAGSCIP